MFGQMPDFNQSLEMMKTMWGNMGAGADGINPGAMNFSGAGAANPFGIPTMDLEELDKKIKELKSVESWLNLNLNVLRTTIQGLEVQRATLGALHAFSESMKSAQTEAASAQPEKSEEEEKADKTPENDPMDSIKAASGMAVDMMNNMAQTMTDAMASIPGVSSPKEEPKATPKKRAAAKTSKPRQSKARASTYRAARDN